MIRLLQLRPYTTDGDYEAPSPNHEARKSSAIEGIVLHATADEGNEAGTLTWLRSPKSRASCHLVVSRSGQVTRLVGDQQRAWHAGLSFWRGTNDVNSITLGIEIANRNDGEPYTNAQYRRVAEIVAHYCNQGLSLDDVVSHEAVAADRRTDPYRWDWDRFRALVQDQLLPPPAPPLQAGDVEDHLLTTYDRRGVDRPAQAPSVIPAVATVQQAAMVAPRQQSPPAPARPRPMVVRGKPMACSRTIWLNGLTMLAAGSIIVSETLDVASSVGFIVPKDFTMWVLLAVGFVNILLRLQTTCPIGDCQIVPGATPVGAPRVNRPSGQDTGRAAPGPR